MKVKRPVFGIASFLRYAAVFLLLTGISVLMYMAGSRRYFSSDPTPACTSVVAEKGQISKVILPDSSVVWLNSGTTLVYDHHFAITNRDLKLTGQAFFQVEKNRILPMSVNCGRLQVKVTGTRFDVSAYPEDEKIQVSLESGGVELKDDLGRIITNTLKPGEMAEFNTESGHLQINKGQATYSAWRNGSLLFVDSPMSEVIKKLERKFDIQIMVRDPKIYKSVFTANFKDESLKEILDYMQFVSLIRYELGPIKGETTLQVLLYYQ